MFADGEVEFRLPGKRKSKSGIPGDASEEIVVAVRSAADCGECWGAIMDWGAVSGASGVRSGAVMEAGDGSVRGGVFGNWGRVVVKW